MSLQKHEENTLSEVIGIALNFVFGIMAVIAVIPLVFLVIVLLGLLMANHKIQEVSKDILGGR